MVRKNLVFSFQKIPINFPLSYIRSVLFQPVLGITEKRMIVFVFFFMLFLLEEKEGGENPRIRESENLDQDQALEVSVNTRVGSSDARCHHQTPPRCRIW